MNRQTSREREKEREQGTAESTDFIKFNRGTKSTKNKERN